MQVVKFTDVPRSSDGDGDGDDDDEMSDVIPLPMLDNAHKKRNVARPDNSRMNRNIASR